MSKISEMTETTKIQELPIEIIDHIITFINFDLETLLNFRKVSEYFKKATEEQYKIVELYMRIFNTPKVDKNNILLIDEMCEHLSYLDLKSQFTYDDLLNHRSELIPITLAKDFDYFSKIHNNIDHYITCHRARGRCSILLNNYYNYSIVQYLLYLGANPNCTTSKEGYPMTCFIMNSDLNINQQAKTIGLLIEYGLNIYLADGDVGESTLFHLENNFELRELVLQELELNSLEELISKYD